MQRLLYSLLLPLLTLVTTAQSLQWKALFNGKDLTGWKQLNGKAKYSVKDETIIGETVYGEPNSFLITEKNYGDFVLELEFKLDAQMNSGIQFRSESKEDYQKGRVHGYQFEIDPSPRSWTGAIYDEARRDWIYSLDLNPPAKTAYKQNDWNKCRIECLGNTLRTFINGREAAFVIDDLTPSGFIALQVHSIGNAAEAGRTIRWRKLRIHEGAFTPTPQSGIFVLNLLPNNLHAAEIKNGVRMLWDGKTTNGWRGAYKNEFPAKGWQIAEGVLKVMPSGGGESTNGGDIVTIDTFGAFIFQFEFKMTEGANSGVKYFVTETEQNSGSAIGLEYQILDDARHPDAKMGSIGNRTLASLYDLIPSLPEPRARRKIGEWNRGMIMVHPDNRVEHWLNGWKVVEYQRGVPYYKALVARSKYEQWPNFGMAPYGHLLLQDHGNEVWFRSLKVQKLN